MSIRTYFQMISLEVGVVPFTLEDLEEAFSDMDCTMTDVKQEYNPVCVGSCIKLECFTDSMEFNPPTSLFTFLGLQWYVNEVRVERRATVEPNIWEIVSPSKEMERSAREALEAMQKALEECAASIELPDVHIPWMPDVPSFPTLPRLPRVKTKHGIEFPSVRVPP